VDEISDLQKKADAGDASAQWALAKAYETGNGARQNPGQAAAWYRKAADQGNAKAQNSLGVLYWLGDGVDKDKKEAVQWYRKAARQGDASAMFNLGAAYYNGEGVAAIDDTLALAWFLLSSEAGNSSGRDAAQRSIGEHRPDSFNEACFAIGGMYEKGDDLPKNLDLASAWYRKAAEQGQAQAQMGLASLSLDAKNYSEAHHWCEEAAKRKSPGGYYCLGYLFQHGLGVEQNPKTALKWYQDAAGWSNAGAMQALGQMFANGEGTKQDRAQAFVWFFKAARRGNKEAIPAANNLRASMSAKEWKDTEKKLKEQGFDPQKVVEGLAAAGSPPPQ
jgi:uncharacterized protein